MGQLFLDTLPNMHSISIGDVANELQVSESSVRNWIKTGYLELQSDGLIAKDSYDKFSEVVVGSDKLVKRANKKSLDHHDHQALQEEFFKKIKKMNSTELQLAGNCYENRLSFSYRNKEGVYYTPSEIAESFFDFVKKDTSELTFCDPCCGSGNFVMSALEKGILPENVYGFDIDPIAVEITKTRIKDKFGFDAKNIMVLDFFEDVIINKKAKIPDFDIIFTNPPWGKKLNNGLREKITDTLNCPKNCDTSALFFLASMHIANRNAIVGMLLPEAFFNVGGFNYTRNFVSDYRIIACIDYGKVFKGLLTKAQSLILKKSSYKQERESKIFCKSVSEAHFRSQASFKSNPKTIFNFSCTEQEHKVIQSIYSKEHLTLKGNAKWGMGIVTGSNKKFVKPTQEINCVPVYKGIDIKPDGLANPKNFISADLSLYQQTAASDFYYAKEKLVYRFISSDLVFYHDTGKNFFLNSANMLILNDNFPVSYKNLAWLFNTDIMNWLFRKIFNTCKVLRSDIECLPIFHQFFASAKDTNEEKLLDYLDVERDNYGTYRIKR